MAGNYTVQQGDFLTKIAKASGFADYHSIWDHPNNAQLKQQRQNPNVLFPGDILFIPDSEDRTESRPTGKSHVFRVNSTPLTLQLVLEDLYERPVANAPCNLQFSGGSRQVTTDASGKIKETIPPDTHDVVLVIQSGDTPAQNVPIPIHVGDLDPEDRPSGQAARLTNLGYYFGDLKKIDAAAFSSAVEEFQCDHGLQVDGKCGPTTQAKLKQVHGC